MWSILVLSGSLEFYKCCYCKSNSTFDFCFRLSCLCDGNSVIPEWIHSFKFLNFDVNFLLRMRIFHCLLSVFFFLFDHQPMSGSFVVRSAGCGPFSTNQVNIIYKVKIIDLLPPADNFVLPEFSSMFHLLYSRKIWTGEIYVFQSILVQNHLLNVYSVKIILLKLLPKFLIQVLMQPCTFVCEAEGTVFLSFLLMKYYLAWKFLILPLLFIYFWNVKYFMELYSCAYHNEFSNPGYAACQCSFLTWISI